MYVIFVGWCFAWLAGLLAGRLRLPGLLLLLLGSPLPLLIKPFVLNTELRLPVFTLRAAAASTF